MKDGRPSVLGRKLCRLLGRLIMKNQKETIERIVMNASDGIRRPTSNACLAFVAPGDTFRHPREVLEHPELSLEEKRAILAWWASDIHSIESAPWLRCLPGDVSEAVPVGDIFAALAELDADYERERGKTATASSSRGRSQHPYPESHWLRGLWRDDDDDDPPPCPATIGPRPKLPAGGMAVVATAG